MGQATAEESRAGRKQASSPPSAGSSGTFGPPVSPSLAPRPSASWEYNGQTAVTGWGLKGQTDAVLQGTKRGAV